MSQDEQEKPGENTDLQAKRAEGFAEARERAMHELITIPDAVMALLEHISNMTFSTQRIGYVMSVMNIAQLLKGSVEQSFEGEMRERIARLGQKLTSWGFRQSYVTTSKVCGELIISTVIMRLTAEADIEAMKMRIGQFLGSFDTCINALQQPTLKVVEDPIAATDYLDKLFIELLKQVISF